MCNSSFRILLIVLIAGCMPDADSDHENKQLVDPPIGAEVNRMEVEIVADDLLLPSSEDFSALSVVHTDIDKFVIMLNDCAYGNIAGTRVLFAYSNRVPDQLSRALEREGIPKTFDYVVAKEIIERRIKDLGGSYREFQSSIECLK